MDENTRPGGSPEHRRTAKYSSNLPRLNEISASEANARNPTVMPPPGTSVLKHKPSGLPEPTMKRKTLADRAGEIPTTQAFSHAHSRSVNGIVPPSTAAHARNSSFSSSTTSSRMLSGSSRTTSSASSNSMRQPAHGAYRPQSAMSVNRNPLQASVGNSRPLTSFDNHVDENNARRKGTLPFSYTSSSSQDPSSIRVARQRQRGRAPDDEPYMPWSSWALPSRSNSIAQRKPAPNPFRELSLNTKMEQLSLDGKGKYGSSATGCHSDSPTKIPTPVPHTPVPPQPLPTVKAKRSRKSLSPNKPPQTPVYLTRDSNLQAAWDTKGRLDDMEKTFSAFREQMATTEAERTSMQSNLEVHMNLYKTRISELESIRSQLSSLNSGLQGELEASKVKLNSTTVALEDSRRTHNLELDDLRRKHRNEVEDLRDEHKRNDDGKRTRAQDELDQLRRQQADEMAACRQNHAAEVEKFKTQLEEETSRRLREIQDVQNQWSLHRQNAELDASARDREEQKIRAEVEQLKAAVEHEHQLNSSLREKMAESAVQAASLESSLDAAKAKTQFLESDSQAQSQAFADLNRRMQEAIDSAAEANAKLRAEETLRRKLHNQVQELKGNIRVFCRVRPTLDAETDESAKINFPDADDENKELVVTGPEAKSAIGTDRTSKHNFSFDRVFGPSCQNPEVFEEISQLVQSALDGYNVCIFCYGQTGSGKTHTMSSSDGMIPLAVQQIYETANGLEEKGWRYSMEGSFVEVYNENLNDLLGKASELDKKKLEIKHDMQRGKTTITDVTTIKLDSPSTVNSLLERAASNRSVAATKANERSSRSHSVFILKLDGENLITGEKSEGTLNLVDLAGSERLAHSQATGDRLKETQNINKSLSSLGDVIGALGQGQGKDGAHIPYRNSKLTYLLQQSLGGNSKTLMFVMVSPLQAHLGETITSLKFATKVHNTHIGTAKKQTKVKD